MAYNVEKLAKLGALKELGLKQKAVDEAQNKRIKALEDVGAQANVLEGVKVNGVALAIAEKMVDILVATGSKNGSISVAGTDVAIKGLAALAYKAKISQSDLDDALAAVLAAKADKTTTLGGYGITDAYTKDEINAKISAVYKPAGSVVFSALPALAENVLGNVYNVTDAFTTTNNFVEGAGNKYPKGTNVVVVKVGDAYKYDVLAGFVDLSGYVEKEAGKGLSDENFTAALKDMHKNQRVCAVGSQNGMDCFVQDDDGNGTLRGELVGNIQRCLERRDADYQTRWNRVWASALCQKYRRPESEDYWLWARAFFDAPIFDLQAIAALVQ